MFSINKTLLLTLALVFSSKVSAEKERLSARTTTAPIYSTCKEPGTFAITLDDGPYDYEENIAGTLTANDVTGTFFFNGNNWICIYDRAEEVRAAYKAGNLIGTHTWSHPDLTTLTDSEIEQQFTLLETAFKKILGIKPRFFRPPYGSYNTNILKIAETFGYKVIMWNLDTEDADGASVSYSKEQYTEWAAQDGLVPGIGLEHSPYGTTAHEVVPFAIKTLKEKGYKLVSVAECLGYSDDEWYQETYEPEEYNDTWTCDGTPAGKRK